MTVSRINYFAYGSNMAHERLRARVPSAEKVCSASLSGYQLRFHKVSKKDGSGKCDAMKTSDREGKVYGVVYSILASELQLLDRFEARGFGYDRQSVLVECELGEGTLQTETYLATEFSPAVRPFDWYKEHVIRGARAASLPDAYIELIEAVDAILDPDMERRARELSIYLEQT